MPTFEAGDWNCSVCGDHQFARNTSCRKCGAPKDEGAGDFGAAGQAIQPPQMMSKGGKGNNSAQNFSPGDWCCSACGDHQFARNTVCRRCGNGKHAPPPAQYGQGKGMMGGAMGGAMPITAGAMKPGDWICPACSDHQFSRNSMCRRCGEPRPQSVDGGAMMNQVDPALVQTLVPMMMQQMQKMGFLPQGQQRPAKQHMTKPGDWVCPQCEDLQFARNTECRLCSTPKPAEGDSNFDASRVRSRSPRGRAAEGAGNPQMSMMAGKGW